MLNKLLITTAVSGLMLSSAWAQYSAPSSSSSAPAAAQSQSGSSASDSMKSDASKSSSSSASSSTSGASSANFVSAQKPDQLLASKFDGTDVVGNNNEKIGDVKDILFTKDGKIEAYIISAGGFLGVGAKEVALAPSAVQLMTDADNNIKLKVSLSKDQLAQAPDFQEHKAARTTTGAGSSGLGSSSSGSGASSTAPRNAPNAPGGAMAPSGSSNAPASR